MQLTKNYIIKHYKDICYHNNVHEDIANAWQLNIENIRPKYPLPDSPYWSFYYRSWRVTKNMKDTTLPQPKIYFAVKLERVIDSISGTMLNTISQGFFIKNAYGSARHRIYFINAYNGMQDDCLNNKNYINPVEHYAYFDNEEEAVKFSKSLISEAIDKAYKKKLRQLKVMEKKALAEYNNQLKLINGMRVDWKAYKKNWSTNFDTLYNEHINIPIDANSCAVNRFYKKDLC